MPDAASSTHPLIVTPRLAGEIWKIVSEKLYFRFKPDSPSEATFSAHCLARNSELRLMWSDPALGIAYAYDLRTHQIAADPPTGSHAHELEIANRVLRDLLPPSCLDGPVDWAQAWKDAVMAGNRRWMKFCEEQGFNPKTGLSPVDLPKLWFRAAQFADADMLRGLLTCGCDVNTRDEHGHTALGQVTGLFGGSLPAVKLLVEAGIKLEDVEAIIEWNNKSVTAAGEANEADQIAAYLRKKAAAVPSTYAG